MGPAYRKLFLLSLITIAFKFVSAQTDSIGSVQSKKYKLFIDLIEELKVIKGYPVAINDSGIWITKGLRPRKSKITYSLIFVKADNIGSIRFRRKGKIGWGILAGSAGGAIAGTFIFSGIASSKHPDARSSAKLTGAGVGLKVGGLAGGVIGGKPNMDLRIRGDINLFQNAREKMAHYLPSN